MIKKIFGIPGLIVLTLLLIVVYLGFWVYLRSTVVTGISNYISELETEGYRVEHGGLSVSGFPFALNATTPNLEVRTTPNTPASAAGLWSFNTNKVDMQSPTVTPLSWTIRHSGTLGVNAPTSAFDVSPADINADIAYSLSGTLKSLALKTSASKITRRNGDEPAIQSFDDMHAHIKVSGETAFVDMRADNVILAPYVLGDALGLLTQNLTVLSVKSEIDNWPILELEGLEVWLQSPAKIRSDDWQAKWGNLDLVGSYDLGFDNGRPEGIVRFRVKNIDALVQNLVELGMLDLSFAGQIKTVANSMASDEDGRKLIELTIRDGVVKYGFFTLYRF